VQGAPGMPLGYPPTAYMSYGPNGQLVQNPGAHSSPKPVLIWAIFVILLIGSRVIKHQHPVDAAMVNARCPQMRTSSARACRPGAVRRVKLRCWHWAARPWLWARAPPVPAWHAGHIPRAVCAGGARYAAGPTRSKHLVGRQPRGICERCRMMEALRKAQRRVPAAAARHRCCERTRARKR
jgi:hypothetical protein